MVARTLTLKRARGLRRRMTLPEVLLWETLRGRRLDGLKFRRQHPIGPYILDVYCPSAKLAVELDGTGHETADQTRRDQIRDRWLREQGVHVLRLAAMDVLDPHGGEVLVRRIAVAAQRSSPAP